MMEDLTFKIFLAVAASTYSVAFGIVAKKVWDVPKMVETKLKEFQNEFHTRFERIDSESKMAHRRLNVHDRISSKITGKDFDSRAIADSGSFPDIKTKVYE